MSTQSIIFFKKIWNSKNSSIWVMENKLHPIKKMKETKSYYRFTLEEPDKGKKYFTKNMTRGIKLIMSY